MEGWRGPALAALLAVACALPGLIALPVVDRNEAVFAQATAQMLEEHDITDIRFQDRLRHGTMPGAHWLQGAAVLATGRPEARAIWAYRLPSLLGLALCAAAAVIGGRRLFGPRAGFAAGAILATSFLGLTLANLATADALFAAACAIMLAAFGHIYAAQREGGRLRRRDHIIFWTGLIAAFLIKGPVALAFAGLTGLTLMIADRQVRWLTALGWGWGLIALAAIAGPWLIAITVSTDGQFWRGPSAFLVHGAGIGLQSAIAPVLLFPSALILPFAAAYAWKARSSPGVRLSLAWLVPAWLLLEINPGFQLHGAAALYISLAWLGGAGLVEAAGGRAARFASAALSMVVAGLVAAAGVGLAWRFGHRGLDRVWAGLAAVLALGSGLASGAVALQPDRPRRLIATLGLGAMAGWVLLAALLPGLDRLWPTQGVLRGLAASGLDPRDGLTRGPVASTGYEEPSLVFRLGAETQLGDDAAAAAAIADNRPVIVSAEQEADLEAVLAQRGLAGQTVWRFEGYDPAQGEPVTLSIIKRAP